MKQKAYRQGDVIFIPTKEKIEGKKLSHLVMAEGEVTGHKHEILEDNAELYEKDGVLFLKVISPSIVKHNEHKEITLPQGNYMIDIPQEYDYVKEESRKVVD